MASTTITMSPPVMGSPVFHTPSPAFRSVSAASTTGVISSKVFLHRNLNLGLRFFTLLVSFVSAMALAGSSELVGRGGKRFRLLDMSEFRYCIGGTITTSIYSAIQLLKGIWDIAFKGFVVSDNASDYITFILDQMVTYLLLSSTSVTVLGIEGLPRRASKSGVLVSVCMSFVAFVAIAISNLLSGYMLCKRIVW